MTVFSRVRVHGALVVAGLLVASSAIVGGASLVKAATSPVTSFSSLTGPAGSGSFGTLVVVLTNGNYVVTDPGWDNGVVPDVGAVYLYDGATNQVISTLTGTAASDQVGSSGVTALTNGNYVVSSPNWDNGAAANAGAVTFGNGVTGISGPVAPGNSLVGTTTDDRVGASGVTALTNGNYVVKSENWDNGAAANAGAVTFGNGVTGISGPVASSNSLVGTTTNDEVGASGVTALTNGNYVVAIPFWDGAAADVGAVTFGNGVTGIIGEVASSNSLVGTNTSDRVGAFGVTALTNGNYVVASPSWDNGAAANAGAATFANGVTGVNGTIASSNSLVGTTANDQVGAFGVTALTNGNYVVRSPRWNNGAATDVGAATFGNGVTGVNGPVAPTNSLVGTTANDQVGSGTVTALTNGNYVVNSSNWDNGAVVNVGAATFANGVNGVSGTVGLANSLVGTTTNDRVGSGTVTALTNGNYVVTSPNWDNGAATDAGAATFGNGVTGVNGPVAPTNSLVGTTTNDRVGQLVTALTNGNYVVNSSNWDNGAAANAGAATFGNGVTGISGTIAPTNSLVGTTTDDQVGSDGVTALTNGNYVVASPGWDDGAAANAGAATFGNGVTGISGTIAPTNSLVGTTANNFVGSSGVTALTNGNYVVTSPAWDGAAVNAGAVTYGSESGVTGVVTVSNSAIGTPPGSVESPSARLTSGNAVVIPTTQNQVLLLQITTLPATNTPPPPSSSSVMRLAGPDRYSTAAAIAAKIPCSTAMIVVSGETAVDALAAAGLAGKLDAPVLLTRSATLPDVTRDAIQQCATTAPQSVYIIGGTTAIDDNVAAAVSGLANVTVTRISGIDRYDTATKVAAMIGPNAMGTLNNKRTAFVGSGTSISDLLAAGPAAYRGTGNGPLPILLTQTNLLRPATSTALTATGIEHVIIVGGPGVVSPDVEAAIVTQGITVQRIAGTNRYSTATALAELATTPTAAGGLGFHTTSDTNTVCVANGTNTFGGYDALAAAPLCGHNNAPLLLTDNPLRTEPQTMLTNQQTTINTATILGGTTAITTTTATAIAAAIT